MISEIMIAGPTASGKTALAIELAKRLDGEIISVDSRQCYQRLDIGTAKPTPTQLSEIVHHNISVLSLEENDSAATFYERVEIYRKDIKNRGKAVIFCGGSTLHLQSLIQPLDDMPSANRENLAHLELLAEKEGLPGLFQLLEKHDPEYAKKMDGLNRQRIFRALDVWMQTGKPFSSFHQQAEPEAPEHMSVFVLHHPRKELHHRISLRTEQMFEEGLIEETRRILEDGYSPQLQSLQTVGYREVIAFLEGKMSRQQMVENVKTSTRRYAKRQITWMKRWPFATRLDMSGQTAEENIQKMVNLKLNNR